MNIPDKNKLARLYYLLVKIRRFEEMIIRLYRQQEMRCPVHLCEGQEAIAVGVCSQLKKTDYCFSTHRNHGHLIAKGCDCSAMLAEIYGRSTGCSKGKGGSMHMVSKEFSVPGTSAIVAGGIPLGVGTALASQYSKDGRVSAAFFGDGAVDEGTFYESLNFAAVRKLPVIFVCENNLYATNSHQRCRQANCDIHRIGDFFKILHECIDGNSLLEVYNSAAAAIAHARKGNGPVLLEARTFRIRTHVGPETDLEKGLRREEEVAAWKTKCPVAAFRGLLLSRRLLSERRIGQIEVKVDTELAKALVFARKSPLTDACELLKDVY